MAVNTKQSIKLTIYKTVLECIKFKKAFLLSVTVHTLCSTAGQSELQSKLCYVLYVLSIIIIAFNNYMWFVFDNVTRPAS